MRKEKISYAKTVYGQEEIDAVIQCLNESTQMGQYSRQFERKIASLFNKKYGLYVNSGSSALYIGIESFNFEQGSEIITPALTFSTTVGSILKNDLIPVFIDTEPLSYCINVSQIEKAISSKTVAIMAPNLLGNICNWVYIRALADKHNLIVIEDSADTLGAKINGVSTGKYTDMSITSFYGSHIINCAGNGGALTLNSKQCMENAKLLRSWGRSSSLFDESSELIENRFNISLDGIDYDKKFVFEKIGYNLEGSEIGAAFGLKQLEKLSKNIELRQANYIKQINFFKKYNQFFSLPSQLPNTSTAWLAFPILINKDAPFTRKQFQIYLEKNGIQTRVIFTGNILRQPMCKGIPKRVMPEGYPNADRVMENGVLLPVHHAMTDSMYQYFFDKLISFLEIYT